MANITLDMTAGRLLKIIRGDKFEVTMTGTPQEQETITVSENSVIQKRGGENNNGDAVGGTINFFGNILFGGRAELAKASTLDVVVSLPDACNLTLNINGLYQTVSIDDTGISSLHISVNGSTRVSAQKAKNFCGYVNGSGSITLQEISGSAPVEVVVNGSGDIKVSGGSGTISASVNGSGDITMNDVHQGNMFANISGSGSITITGQLYTLVSNIAGSGHVGLTTSERPHTVSKAVSGSGRLSIDVVS